MCTVGPPVGRPATANVLYMEDDYLTVINS